MRDHYDVLGISSNATQEEIKQAYREKVRLWHPDRNKSEEAHERIIEINKAYEVLGDPEERRYYDFYRANGTHSTQQQHTYTTYEPPPYQPKRETYRQERRFQPEWGRVFFLAIVALFALARLLNNWDKSFPTVSQNFTIRNSNLYGFDKNELANNIDLENVSLSPYKVFYPYTITYLYTSDSTFEFDEEISLLTNLDYDTTIRKEWVNTIIVYRYLPDTRKIDSKKAFYIKLYFIDKKDFSVFRTSTLWSKPTELKPTQTEIINAILNNMGYRHIPEDED